MSAIVRYERFRDEALDKILLEIKRGGIKSGRYSKSFKPIKLNLKKEFEFHGTENKTK